jgi:hypothetical protein
MQLRGLMAKPAVVQRSTQEVTHSIRLEARNEMATI